MDLAQDGALDVIDLEAPAPGFAERTPDGGWHPFVPFRSMPGIDPRDPNLRLVDLTGNGLPDLLVTEDEVFTWHASLAEEGYGPAVAVRAALDDEKGPRVRVRRRHRVDLSRRHVAATA